MRTSVVILLLHISFAAGSQNIVDIENALRQHRQVSAILSDSAFVKTRVLSNANYRDTQDFKVVAYGGFFNDDFRTDGARLTEPVYTIKLYSLHDTVFVTRMNKLIYTPDSVDSKPAATTLVFKADTALLLRYIAQHNNKYRSSWSIDDFFKEDSDYGSFSFFCGYVPRITKEAYALCKLVKEKNLSALKALASSFRANERAFGTAGLFFLQLQGEKLSTELTSLMELNRQSTIAIPYCDGCIIGSAPMCKQLEYERVYYLHKMFVKNLLL